MEAYHGISEDDQEVCESFVAAFPLHCSMIFGKQEFQAMTEMHQAMGSGGDGSSSFSVSPMQVHEIAIISQKMMVTLGLMMSGQESCWSRYACRLLQLPP